jgi:WD domain, G-beta repeat.
MLVFGHSSGHITAWSLDICKDTCQATLCQEYSGHTGVIMSISLSIDIDLIVSGATDFMAKVWCLSTGSLVKTITCHSHWVIQVALLPTLGCANSRTLYQGKHSLLTKTRDHIRIFSWPSESKDGNIFGDTDEVEMTVIEIPLNPVHNFYTPGCYVQNGKVSYVKQSMVKDDEDGNAEIVLESLATRARVCEVYLKRKVRKLLAIGEKFALILLPHSHTNKYNLLVIEVSSGNVIGGCHLPHSR